MQFPFNLSFKNLPPRLSFRTLFYSILGILVILLIIDIFLTISILGTNKVYNGVYLNGIHMGGMTLQELNNYLDKTYKQDIGKFEINIYHQKYPRKVSFSELGVKIDLKKTAYEVYNIGRQGSILKRLFTIYSLQKKHLYLYIDISFDKKKIFSLIDEIYNNTYIPTKSPKLLISRSEVILCSGTYGYSVDKSLLFKRICNQIKSLRSGIVIVPVIETPPPKIQADAYYNQIVREAKDAYPEVLENKNVIIHPHVVGIKLEKSEFLSYVAQIESRESKAYIEKRLPVEFIIPEITTDKAKKMLFGDILGTYKTYFPLKTTNDINRSNNISLAVAKINGTILAPGEVFSFNDIVGRRTLKKGYKYAHAYYGNKIIDAVGGGVCQVSTTLFNAAVLANLRIIERHNHSFKVDYVELGRDAAVAYGEKDLQFQNNTSWPIRIDGKIEGSNSVLFTINGTNFHPNLSIHIFTRFIKKLPFKTEYIDTTPDRPDNITLQKGMNGAVVDTYKVVESATGMLKEYKLFHSTYLPLNEKITRETTKIKVSENNN